MSSWKRLATVGTLLGAFVGWQANTASADTIVWGNNATNGNVTLEAFDLSTGGTLVDQFIVPNAVAARDNGRGIAVVGTTIYYSTANLSSVFITDSNTHADLGSFDTCANAGPCLNGIATVAWDGTDLWVTGYNGTNNAYKYLPDGTLVGTVVGFGNSRDGFEITGNHLIANNGDAEGPYDLYDLNGNLTTPGFITTTFEPTGITFDGTNYYVSNIFNNQIATYDINGNFVSTTVLGGPAPPTCCGRLLEDLSALGNIPSNPPPGVPEPATMVLVGSGLVGAYVRRRRRA